MTKTHKLEWIDYSKKKDSFWLCYSSYYTNMNVFVMSIFGSKVCWIFTSKQRKRNVYVFEQNRDQVLTFMSSFF
jgi:hypothetical protein